MGGLLSENRLKVEGDRVQLLYIGWGLIKDIQGVQISILEDR